MKSEDFISIQTLLSFFLRFSKVNCSLRFFMNGVLKNDKKITLFDESFYENIVCNLHISINSLGKSFHWFKKYLLSFNV